MIFFDPWIFENDLEIYSLQILKKLSIKYSKEEGILFKML